MPNRSDFRFTVIFECPNSIDHRPVLMLFFDGYYSPIQPNFRRAHLLAGPVEGTRPARESKSCFYCDTYVNRMY